MKNKFPHDYDLKNLLKINFGDFIMNVTQRYSWHYKENEYEKFSSDIFLNYVEKNSVIVDIGANYGYYSLLASSVNKEGKTYAVEPVKENFEILNKNILENKFDQIKTYNLAISNFSGEKEFNVTEASDSSGFYNHPNTKTFEKRLIKTETIDNLFEKEKIDIIKIDVEGDEINVLEGMKKTIENNPEIKIFFEFNPSCLKNAGFNPQKMLEKLENNDLEVFFINEDERQLSRLKNPEKWKDYIKSKDYCNILCTKKDSLNLISFISHSAQLGGSERSLLELLKELIKKENNSLCHVFLPENGPLEEELEKLPVSYEITAYRWWTLEKDEEKEFSIRQIIEQSIALSKKIEFINPNIIYSNTSVINVGAIIAKELKIPHIWHIREYGEIDHHLKFILNKKDRTKYISSNSDFVIFNSESIKEHYLELSKFEHNLVIYNNVSLPIFNRDNLKIKTSFTYNTNSSILVTLVRNSLDTLIIFTSLNPIIFKDLWDIFIDIKSHKTDSKS